MGTLSGLYSFSNTLDFSFKPREIHKPRHTNRPKNICLLYCGGTSLRKKTERKIQIVCFRNFGRNFRCYSTSNGNNGNGDRERTSTASSNDSNATNTTTSTTTTTTTTIAEPHEEAEERQRNDFESDKSTPPSVSSPPPTPTPLGPAYNNFQVDSFKLMELLGPEKVDPADVKLIKDKLFGYSTFWVTKEEPFGDLGEGILFLGNLRGNREKVFAKLQSQLVELTVDKYNLFMVEEPNSDSPDPRGGPRVSFGLLRKEVSEPGPTTLWQYVIAFLLFLLTIGSSVELGIASQINRLPPEVVKYFTDPNAIEPPDMELLFPFVDSALPLAYGVLGVLLFHEVGHFVAAFPKKVKLSIPYFIPNITLGSFGAITQFKSILPDRTTKVDVSLAGPFAGAALSFSMFAVGLLLSSNPNATGDLVQVPSMLFQGSLLLGLISRATLGYAAMHAGTVSIHPLVIAGWCGLTTTAFNMLPVGCLDGGRAVQGAFGKNALIGFGLTTYTLLGLGVLGGPLSLPWGLYVLICQRTPEKPCLNDVTEVGTWRKALVSVAIFLVVLTLLPVWDELAEELGIGLVTTF
ncbi:probable zinc metalloprotease EGY1, chloroplastic isoform X1 [Ziziphus jujuba]|uniref:Probable zinc metalloprotease EGY1, chloroplastic isoform X1 n=1 Tax=Ziziphus jujuba TaxID=326968 RepID=A0A6P4BCF7_ZIZJJ|nr:probable zinc metalloprotease EGY1, chloroplastic isoform X1 [Ziziphus jujuba]